MKRGAVSLILSFLLTLGAFTLGAASGLDARDAKTAALLLSGALGLCAAGSALLYLYEKRRLARMRVAEANALALAAGRRAEEDLDAEVASLIKKLLPVRIWLWLLAAALIFAAFLCGAASPVFEYIPVLLLALYALWGIVHIRLQPFFMEKPEGVLPREEFPEFYALAGEAQRAAGGKRRVLVALREDGNVGVSALRSGDCIALDARLAKLLTRGELYQVLLHEFAHLYMGVARKIAVVQRWDGLLRGIDLRALRLPGAALMLYPAFCALCRYDLFEAAAAREVEKRADAFAMERGDARAYADALGKIKMLYLFNTERCPELSVDAYAGEAFTRRYYTESVSLFERYLAREEARWRELAAREITAQIDSHPTLKTRLAALGAAEYGVCSREAGTPFALEQDRLLARADGEIYKRVSPDYERMRGEIYVDRLAAIEAYEAAADVRALSAKARLDAAHAYADVDNAKALAAYRSLAADEPENCYAHFALGEFLLSLYRDEGIGSLYRAAELNGSMAEQACERIGSYCVRTGNEAELARYRARVADAMQSAADRSRALRAALSKGALAPSPLPEAVREEAVRAVAERCGEVCARVYLAARRVPGGGETNVFLLSAKEGADPEEFEAAAQSAFEYLDMRPEQFALVPAAGRRAKRQERLFLKRVPDSLVWRAEPRA